jgi:hypothetical protein
MERKDLVQKLRNIQTYDEEESQRRRLGPKRAGVKEVASLVASAGKVLIKHRRGSSLKNTEIFFKRKEEAEEFKGTSTSSRPESGTRGRRGREQCKFQIWKKIKEGFSQIRRTSYQQSILLVGRRWIQISCVWVIFSIYDFF